MKRILVTGGAGFIGSHFVDLALKNGASVAVLDSLTYAGNLENLSEASKKPEYEFHRGEIQNAETVQDLLSKFKPTWIVNFAAESHVDRSIEGPQAFIETNIQGTFVLLQESLRYYRELKKIDAAVAEKFRYLQISTDEVFGMLGLNEPAFTEKTPYAPSSPYSASKASADHLVRAWNHTYGLPTLITNCTNNYGSRQYPEKLIPFVIRCALRGEPLPVYGTGKNIRDWIHVSDHVRGVWLALEKGRIGESYCFGGHTELQNIDLVRKLCLVLDRIRPQGAGKGVYADQIQFVADRLGHDFRYAIDDSKAQRELGYLPEVRFQEGLQQAVEWFVNKLG